MSLSGSKVERYAVKTGARAREQGEFIVSLHAHDLKILPRVLTLLPDGYIMEWLEEAPFKFTVVEVVLAAKQLHRIPTAWKWEMGSFLNYLRPRCGNTLSANAWGWYVHSVQEESRQIESLQTGTAHGDLTLDNVMLRGEEVVLIDPLPPHGGCLPGVINDAGKLALSLQWVSRELDVARAFNVPQRWVDISLISHALRVLPYARRAENLFLVQSCDEAARAALQRL